MKRLIRKPLSILGPILLLIGPPNLLQAQAPQPAVWSVQRQAWSVVFHKPPQEVSVPGRVLTNVVLRDAFSVTIRQAPAAPHAAATPTAPTVTPAGLLTPQAYAASLVGPGQIGCLTKLWNGESGWRWNAGTPGGAYGVPQALPGSKMASAGADWLTNPQTQIRWGLSYIHARYGSPCAALAAWEARAPHWY